MFLFQNQIKQVTDSTTRGFSVSDVTENSFDFCLLRHSINWPYLSSLDRAVCEKRLDFFFFLFFISNRPGYWLSLYTSGRVGDCFCPLQTRRVTFSFQREQVTEFSILGRKSNWSLILNRTGNSLHRSFSETAGKCLFDSRPLLSDITDNSLDFFLFRPGRHCLTLPTKWQRWTTPFWKNRIWWEMQQTGMYTRFGQWRTLILQQTGKHTMFGQSITVVL